MALIPLPPPIPPGASTPASAKGRKTVMPVPDPRQAVPGDPLGYTAFVNNDVARYQAALANAAQAQQDAYGYLQGRADLTGTQSTNPTSLNALSAANAIGTNRLTGDMNAWKDWQTQGVTTAYNQLRDIGAAMQELYAKSRAKVGSARKVRKVGSAAPVAPANPYTLTPPPVPVIPGAPSGFGAPPPPSYPKVVRY